MDCQTQPRILLPFLSRPVGVAMLAAILVLGSCTVAMQSTASPETTRGQNLDGFPYSPLVYHLDLSVLAYQLYGQTLVWRFDPYYEEFASKGKERREIMGKVRDWAQRTGAEQVRTRPPFGGYRGPGMLAGLADNPRADPIIYRYDQLYPWRSTITNPAGQWTEYTPPDEITGNIRDAYTCYRKTGKPENNIAVQRVVSGRGVARPGARDVLLAFEGSTGDKGEPGQPASRSLMGFVLLRHLPGSDAYDAHIVFRGSRSGAVERAAITANFTTTASGNPDWITDLGWTRIGPDEGASTITTIGQVHRGFAMSIKQTLPQVFACLNRGAALVGGKKPRNIYVTGHSLGGGLAQHFVSALLLGNSYGPNGGGPAMPARLKAWPWKQIKLITYSAPTAGDPLWAETMTKQGLQSEFFDTAFEPIDRLALAVNDATIPARLTDPSRPLGYRVLISTDPITTQKLTGGKHVGKTVYVNKLGPFSPFAVAKISSHEPENIRELMLKTFDDPRNPAQVIRYREMSELNPSRDKAERGKIGEFDRLRAAILRYYAETGASFDTATFGKDFETFKSILAVE